MLGAVFKIEGVDKSCKCVQGNIPNTLLSLSTRKRVSSWSKKWRCHEEPVSNCHIRQKAAAGRRMVYQFLVLPFRKGTSRAPNIIIRDGGKLPAIVIFLYL